VASTLKRGRCASVVNRFVELPAAVACMLRTSIASATAPLSHFRVTVDFCSRASLKQVISTRVDLFPPAYTTKLASLQDSLEPMPEGMVEAIVSQELLEGEPLDRLFQSFDAEPLGCASIAQVPASSVVYP